MIPGSIGDAVGIFFYLAGFGCAAIAARCAAKGIAEIFVGTLTGTKIESDSGTAAVLFAGAFVLIMLARVATA
jgi:uncharacterized membrane protein required for colicin V production